MMCWLKVRWVIRLCVIEFIMIVPPYLVFPTDLIEMPFKDFDVIIGMD